VRVRPCGEAVADRLAVLAVESARFKDRFRPPPGVFAGALHPAAFFAGAPGEGDRARFGRVVRVAAWLLLLLGRKAGGV